MTMGRALIFVIVIGGAIALATALFPQIDLWVSGLFFTTGQGFWLGRVAALDLFRTLSMWPSWGFALYALALLILRFFRPQTKGMSNRAALFLLLGVLLAPLFTVNAVLKDHWGRARPAQVIEFGGPWTFTPWYRVGLECPENCSFVSGEMAGATYLFAPASLTPPPYRPYAYALVAVYAGAVGLLRIAYGGHFFSDVALSALVTLLILASLRRFLLR
jgi:lipid A 4'-phosphatase